MDDVYEMDAIHEISFWVIGKGGESWDKMLVMVDDSQPTLQPYTKLQERAVND